jgi:hypothetical protein
MQHYTTLHAYKMQHATWSMARSLARASDCEPTPRDLPQANRLWSPTDHAFSNTHHATCNTHDATYLMLPHTMQHARCCTMQHARCNTHDATHTMQHTRCNTHHGWLRSGFRQIGHSLSFREHCTQCRRSAAHRSVPRSDCAHARVQSRRRCGIGDVAGVSPVTAQMWQRQSPVPAQMWHW